MGSELITSSGVLTTYLLLPLTALLIVFPFTTQYLTKNMQSFPDTYYTFLLGRESALYGLMIL